MSDIGMYKVSEEDMEKVIGGINLFEGYMSRDELMASLTGGMLGDSGGSDTVIELTQLVTRKSSRR